MYRRAVRKVLVWIACAWNLALASVAQGPRFNISPPAVAGKKLFAQSCSSCHEVTTCNQFIGPGVKSHYTGRYLAPNDAAVRELVTRVRGKMPGFASFTDTELADLIAYLRTL